MLLDDLLYKPEHSLIDQSFHARLEPHARNGDGFGVGWYDPSQAPTLYRGIEPVWNDHNLRDLSAQVRSGLIFAHVRSSTGTAVQHTNCHPFRHGRWLWMHNGLINDFAKIKRELVLGIDPSLYPMVEGTSDTEIFFFLALTFGLEEDPITAVQQAVGFIEYVGQRCGVEFPVRMSVAVTDGRQIWGFRYSTERQSPTLYFSTSVQTLRAQYPEIGTFQALSDDSRLIVSEPLSDLAGAWNEVPESTCAVIRGGGGDSLVPFIPQQVGPRVVLRDPASISLEVEATSDS